MIILHLHGKTQNQLVKRSTWLTERGDIKFWYEVSKCTLTFTGVLKLTFSKSSNAHVQTLSVHVLKQGDEPPENH